ncbi:MAG: biopolymer transporter ExbD [Pseudomonadota bacterium]
MEISPEPERARSEPSIPMINAVFLLLIFFLMASEIAPPEALLVEPPTANVEAPSDARLVLFVDREGEVAFEDARGREAAFARLSAFLDAACESGECSEAPLVAIRADGAAPAGAVAALLPSLAERGIDKVQLVTVLP